MNSFKGANIQNTARDFMIIAPCAIVYYASFIFNPENIGNIYLYIFQIIADGIAIIITSTLWLTILLDLLARDYHKSNFIYDKNWVEQNRPSVDVLVPVASEPVEIIEKTLENAVALEHPHQVYVLDDGDSAAVKEVAEKLGINYISRPKKAKGFAKSGNLNYGLKQCQSQFFAVFDADHVPKKSFLNELLPFFKNDKVALVQSPQFYTNTDNFIASGTSQAQDVFYKYVLPAKNSYNAAFCVGTNMIYRRSAIDEIGGIALIDHSEDIWTTVLLHEKGYESVFYNRVLARGRAPETIQAFFRQQNRWALGGFTLFFNHNPLFSANLSLDQKIQYFFSNIHYFSGFSILIYLLLPNIYLLFGAHPLDVLHNHGWLIHYLPYFITLYFLPLFLLGNMKLATISISLASFYPYLKAFLSVAFKNEYKWVATEAKKKSFSFFMMDIWPHVFLIVLSFCAILVGWYNPKDVTTTLVTSFWVLVNAYFLFEFVKNGSVAKS